MFQLVPPGIKPFELEILKTVGLQRFLGHLGEILRGNDLVGIDIGTVKKDGRPAKGFFHYQNSL